MKPYPLMIKLDNNRVLVAGGGTVALRKVRALLKTGANVTVISPEMCPEIAALMSEGKLTGIRRPFQPEDVEGCTLIFAATNDPDMNDTIATEAAKRRIPVNDVTNPEKCSFYVPSQITRGDLILAISTSGKSPATAKWLRQKLEKEVGEEYAALVNWMGTLRHLLEQQSITPAQIGAVSRFLLDHDLLESLTSGNIKKTRQLVELAFLTVLQRPVPQHILASLGIL